MIDAAKEVCFRTLRDPFATASEILDVLEYLRRIGEFRRYQCRCFGSELSQMAPDDIDRLFPDMERIPMSIDEHLNHLQTAPDPFASEQDRMVHIIVRLLSGFENPDFNA